MTEQKHLKQLVRERMARTGESYTTARRHVVGGRAADGATVTAPPTRHRLTALLARMMRDGGYVAPHTGEPFSEAMLCGLAGGIGFLYAIFEYAGLAPILTIVAQHHPDPWVPSALGRLGVPYSIDHNGKPGPAAVALDADLDGGRVVLCAVDRGALPWHADVVGMATDPYHVLVTARNGDAYDVLDEGDAPHPMDREAFVAAWSAHKKGRHERLILDAAPVPGTDLTGAVRAALTVTAAHLTGPVLGNSFDANFGLSGMGRLADQLADGKTKAGWARRFAAPEAFASAMLRLHDCLEVEYTAPAATRPLYADFLYEAGELVDDKRLTLAAALYRESARLWSQVSGRAAEVADALGDLPALVWRRTVLAAAGPHAPDLEVAALTERIDALARDADLPAEDERRAVMAELAEVVRRARAVEVDAAALLAASP
jgi:hypothetical protein